MRPLHFLVLKP
ncbi:hypothetical protein BIW11_03979 [Tropilaelaps mercedesae]|uniref:Uncharacterized protein n=1 Tax=Tropilaelaps mercedesae TaxID=418985 RepID=A0A1V9XDE6_9ACAR|nr:hypothetical protein BIW11_03979 [Tropilaelaps mercedesae]